MKRNTKGIKSLKENKNQRKTIKTILLPKRISSFRGIRLKFPFSLLKRTTRKRKSTKWQGSRKKF